MVGVALIGAAIAIALLAAASARLPSLVSTLLTAYLAFVANLGVVTWVLSPFDFVTRGGLAVAEALLLAGALALWWRRGRPGLPLAAGRAVLGRIVREPLTALFLAVVAVLLAYELVLVFTVPPNNWDSLTYHLARVAAWVDHGGIYWIPNAPTPNFNQYPPLAEQQILFLFVATGKGALFALPQYLSELVILVAIYGAARRLGFEVRAAACSAFLFATFSFVATQATTAQNDLFAASFPIVAACLILGNTTLEAALGGVAAGFGLGAKPTAALVVPILVWLALVRGRRVFATAAAGCVAGFVAVGMWVYVLNLAHTGSLSGNQSWTNITAPGQQSIRPGVLSTGVDVVYQILDLAALSDWQIDVFAAVGSAAAVGIAVLALRRGRVRAALAGAAGVAVPFLSPLIIIGVGGVIAFFARRWGFPVRGRLGNVGDINRAVDGASFGPIGAMVLLGIPFVAIVAYIRRRVDARALALAFSFPLFLVLLAQAKYNFFLTRFLLVPAALCAPLFALLLRSRTAIAAYGVVASIAIGLVLVHDPLRPLADRPYGWPWQLNQVQAAYLTDERGVGEATADYQRLVPAHACVGAVLGGNEPAYLLSGANLSHRVVYFDVNDIAHQAYRRFISYVVVTTGVNHWAATDAEKAGWQVKKLGSYWQLAVAPHAGNGEC